MKKNDLKQRSLMCSLALGVIFTSMAPTNVLAMNNGLQKNIMISSYTSELQNGLHEIKAVLKDLGPQNKDSKKLLTAKERERLIHAQYEKVLKEKNRKIFEYMKFTENARKNDKQLSFQGRVNHELKKRNLTSDIDNYNDQLEQYKSDLLSKNMEIEFLQKMLSSRTITLKNKVTHLKNKIKKLNNDFRYMTKKMVNELNTYKEKDLEQINSLREKLIHSSLALAAAQSVQPIYKTIQIDNNQENGLSNEIQDLTSELANLDSKYRDLQIKYKNEVKKNNDYIALSEQREADYQLHIAQLESKVSESSNALMALRKNTSSGRFPASANFAGLSNGELKAELSKQIAKKIKDAKIGFLTEFNENNISITLDEKFFFNRGSSDMNDMGKEKLKTLIKIYSEQLFQHEKIRERISSVSFVGHASPRYKAEAIDPMTASEDAFKFNMKLSTQRAQSVANMIFSPDFGNFEYKETLRNKAVVSGKGFSTPIPKNSRELASVDDKNCGLYDCRKSRRVEIVFEMRDMDNAKK
jgi:chemotaxis protein MotB